MSSIDDRVVKMTFDNAKFETGVATTMATLTKLNHALQSIGSTSGLAGIQKAANQIDLSGLSSNIDKLKQNLASVGATTTFSDIEGAANKVTFGPFTTAIEGIRSRLSTLTNAPSAALDLFKEKLGFKGAEAGLNNIEAASSKVKFAGASLAATDLQKKMAFPGIEGRFADIEKGSSKITFAGIHTAISEVTKGFSILQGAAAVALGNIASKAVVAGGSLIKNLTVGPLTTGLEEYQTNLNSIQTILANTKFQGSSLKDVNAALSQLNTYSDQTIYNFSQMAKNIGTFTAAGVNLKDSVASIKGIANLAALSGSNSQQASTAMYQLSQAIASGRVSLQDWNSVVNAGMGGATFQRALAQTAETMGTVAEGAIKIDKATGKATINGESFRESIMAKPGEESWLTSEVLTNTLSQFTGDLSDAELAAQGFNAAQIKAIQETAITAKKAATEVKTLSGVYDVVRESIGSGWAKTFQTIFGDFNEAKTLFTNVTTVITDFVGHNADARNKVLGDWKELGGRTTLIEAIKDVFEGLISVIKPLKDAFREIFPKKTGEDLATLTDKFADFAEKLKIGPETANNLKHTFAGFFAVLDIGKTIVGEILGVIGDLFGAATSGSGGFLKFTANIGDWLVAVRDAIKEGKGLSNFFDGLSTVLTAPIKLLGMLGDALGSLFEGGGDSSGLSSSMDDMEKSLNPLTIALNAVSKGWNAFLGVLEKVKDALGPMVQEIGAAFGGIGSAIANALVDADFEKFFDVIQTTLIGGIFLAIKKGFSGGVNIDLGGGVLGNLSESFKVLTGSLKAMQHNIQAGTILKIGLAVVALAGGVALLSTIEPKNLATAMTAITVGLAQLAGTMVLMSKALASGGKLGFFALPAIASSMIALAVAVDLLAIAVYAFSQLNWEELAKGLVGVGGALTAVAVGVKFMPSGLLAIAAGLIPIAVALNLLAAAMKIFGTMSWEELGKGLLAVGYGLRVIASSTLLFPPGMVAMGIGLIGIAVALNILALAVKKFGDMDLSTMGKGLLGIAGSLIVIGGAIRTFPPNIALQAAALVLLSIALTGIAGSIALMGNMGLSTIAKGLATIGLALGVLSSGLVKMIGTIPGAAALFIAATALAVLAPVLGILGTMKWKTIISGLGALSALFTVLAVSGKFAAPGIIALGIALNVLAVSVVLAGAGIYLLSSGLAKLGGEGSKGIAAVMIALTAFVALLPKMIIDFLKGIVEILAAMAKLAPTVIASMVKIVESLLEVVIKSAPKMAEATIVLIGEFLRVLNESVPKIIATGFHILLSFLKGMADNIGEVTTQVGLIIINFLVAVINLLPKIIAAGAEVLVKFLLGIANNFPQVVASGAEALVKFLAGVTQNIPKIVAAGANLVAEFIASLAANVGKLIKEGANFVVKILDGIAGKIDDIVKAAVNLMGEFIKAVGKEAPKLASDGADAVIAFIRGVASAIREKSPELGKAGADLGIAIVQGMITGLASMAGEFLKGLKDLAGNAISAVKGIFKNKSPSKVFMEIGRNLMEGAIIGVNQGAPGVIDTLERTSEDMIGTVVNSLKSVPNLLDGLIDLDPTITPILDLSQVEAGAKQLGNLTNVVPITAAASYTQAASISVAQEEAQAVAAKAAVEAVMPITFEQNNYSPESLSTTEIYRRTQNQLAQAKNALGLVS
jgi:tape measure domain-containing protein